MVTEYARLAPQCDAKWSSYVEATTRETLACLSLRTTDRLLDVGCGSDALLHRLAQSPAARSGRTVTTRAMGGKRHPG